MASVALYQPDQPNNTGAILRTCACFGLDAHIIEPCGFPFSIKAIRRGGMDYLDRVTIERHADWQHFLATQRATGRRIILLTTKATASFRDIAYRPDDILLFGQESAGVPDHVHESVDARITIPMDQDVRSLNLAAAVAIVAAEVKHQCDVV